MSSNLCFINTYNFHKNERKKIPAEEYRARIPNVSQLAPTTGREAMGLQIPNASHYWASCFPYKVHLCEHG